MMKTLLVHRPSPFFSLLLSSTGISLSRERSIANFMIRDESRANHYPGVISADIRDYSKRLTLSKKRALRFREAKGQIERPKRMRLINILKG